MMEREHEEFLRKIGFVFYSLDERKQRKKKAAKLMRKEHKDVFNKSNKGWY